MSFMTPYPSSPPPPPGAPSGSGDDSWLLDGEEEALALGPLLPDDYREAPKPRKAETMAIADDLVADHQLRLAQSWEIGEVYDGLRPGYFEEDEEDIADGVIEPMPIATLEQMYHFRCGLLAMHEPYARLLTRDANDDDEAMAVEALVAYDFACEERQYAAEHNAILRFAEPAHLQRYGMLVGLDEIDPQDEDCGLSMSLIDPMTVFPVWSGKAGVTEVYRVYDDTSENIIGNYGGDPGTAEYERIERAVSKLTGKDGSGRMKRGETHTVTQVHNRDWVSVIVDESKELFTRRHEYPGSLPYTIVVGAFGGPTGTTSHYSREPSEVSTDWGQVWVSDASVDIARRLRPFDYGVRLKTHRVAEAVAGRQLTMFKWALDPPKIQQFDPSQKHLKADNPKLRPSETIDVPLPNTLAVITPVVDPLAMAGVNMALQANAQSGVLAQLQSGAIPPQTSGSALNAMLELGGASETVLVRLIQLFKRLRAEKRLEYRMLYGDMLGKPFQRGSIRVPGRSSQYGSTPMYAVTPAMIRRTGTQLDIELHHWRPDVATAQYLSTLRTPSPVTNLPLISDETARRTLKITADPDREGERIKREQLKTLPAILHQETIMQLEAERQQAQEEGDTESEEAAMIAIAELEFIHDRDVMSGNAAGGPAVGAGGQMGGGQAPVPPPPAPAGPALPGNSLPEMGIDVGTQGGRPMGAGGPAQAVTPLTPGAVS